MQRDRQLTERPLPRLSDNRLKRLELRLALRLGRELRVLGYLELDLGFRLLASAELAVAECLTDFYTAGLGAARPPAERSGHDPQPRQINPDRTAP